MDANKFFRRCVFRFARFFDKKNFLSDANSNRIDSFCKHAIAFELLRICWPSAQNTKNCSSFTQSLGSEVFRGGFQ